MARISINIVKEQNKILEAKAPLSSKTIQQLVLDPLAEIPEQELWLYDLANQELVDRLKKSFQKEATIDWDSIKHKFE